MSIKISNQDLAVSIALPAIALILILGAKGKTILEDLGAKLLPVDLSGFENKSHKTSLSTL